MFSDTDLSSLVYEDTDIYLQARKEKIDRAKNKILWQEKQNEEFDGEQDIYNQRVKLCRRLEKQYKEIAAAEDLENKKILRDGKIPPRRKPAPVIHKPKKPVKKNLPYFNEGEMIEDLLNTGSYSRRASTVYSNNPKYAIARFGLDHLLDFRKRIDDEATVAIDSLKTSDSTIKKIGGFIAEQVKCFFL
jgi:hypothetical protein